MIEIIRLNNSHHIALQKYGPKKYGYRVECNTGTGVATVALSPFSFLGSWFPTKKLAEEEARKVAFEKLGLK